MNPSTPCKLSTDDNAYHKDTDKLAIESLVNAFNTFFEAGEAPFSREFPSFRLHQCPHDNAYAIVSVNKSDLDLSMLDALGLSLVGKSAYEIVHDPHGEP